ncbi:MAG: hypothetical protein M3Z21_04550 [Pseudomonadota bacterium]|nr:hypothetical protein [Pseudomonadota bacterium]
MDAKNLIVILNNCGIRLFAEGANIRAIGPLDDDARTLIRENKAELLSALAKSEGKRPKDPPCGQSSKPRNVENPPLSSAECFARSAPIEPAALDGDWPATDDSLEDLERSLDALPKPKPQPDWLVYVRCADCTRLVQEPGRSHRCATGFNTSDTDVLRLCGRFQAADAPTTAQEAAEAAVGAAEEVLA